MSSDDEFDTNSIALPDTEWTRMQIKAGEIAKVHSTSFVDDYNPEQETVQAWIHRRIYSEMGKAAEEWANSVLYGENKGGEIRGILSTTRDIPTGDHRGYEPVHTVVDEIRLWEDESGLNATIPFSRVDRAVLIYFGIVRPEEVRHVHTAYRQRKGKRW